MNIIFNITKHTGTTVYSSILRLLSNIVPSFKQHDKEGFRAYGKFLHKIYLILRYATIM